MPASACTATYVVRHPLDRGGPNWFQARVVVTAGGPGVDGWAVTWTLPAGCRSPPSGTPGGYQPAAATAENMSYNGRLREGETATFGFQGTAPGDAGLTVPPVTCTRTR